MGHEGHEHGHAGDGDDHHHDQHHHHHDDRGLGRPELSLGAGRGKVLFLDAPSGLAGDMIVAALVDVGVPRQIVADALARLPVTGFHVHFGTRERSGIVATSFEVHVDNVQPPRTYGSIRAMLAEATLPDGIRARAQRTFHRLAVAEATGDHRT